jgi:hypothetical protein
MTYKDCKWFSDCEMCSSEGEPYMEGMCCLVGVADKPKVLSDNEAKTYSEYRDHFDEHGHKLD